MYSTILIHYWSVQFFRLNINIVVAGISHTSLKSIFARLVRNAYY